jgi:hypothetical protein
MTMSRSRRAVAALVAVPLLLASLSAAPAAIAQGECSLLSAEEANTNLGTTDLVLSQGSSGSCTFTGAVYLNVGITIGQTFEQIKNENPGGEDLTVAGFPAYLRADSSQLAVDLGDRLASVFAYGSGVTVPRDGMIAIAELVVPRLPAGPDPAEVARLEALIPDTIAGQPVTTQTLPGDMLFGFADQASPAMVALNEELAAQGKSAADVLFVIGQTDDPDDDYGAFGILIRGADASRLIEPLFRGLSTSEEEPTFTPGQIAGRNVITIEGTTEGKVTALAIGDAIAAFYAPDEEIEAIVGTMPS